MAAVHVLVKNLSGNTVGLTLDDERDAERIEYLQSLKRREQVDSVEVRSVSGEEPAEVDEFDQMKVEELKAYAAEHEIDLGDATKKADIAAVIRASGK